MMYARENTVGQTKRILFRITTLALVSAVFLAFAAPAWAAPADLDPSFDGDGKVSTDFGSNEGARATV